MTEAIIYKFIFKESKGIMKSKFLILSLALGATSFLSQSYATSPVAAAPSASAPATPTPAAPPAATASNAPSASAPAAPAVATPVTNPGGDSYLENTQKAVASFSHREILSGFTAASAVPLSSPKAKEASVCVQKLIGEKLYRTHSHNAAARGVVTSAGDLAAFGPLFSLNPKQKFLLNVPKNLDGTGEIVTYIGQVLLKDGTGNIVGDTICFARYLQVAPEVAAASVSAASSSAPAQGAAAASAPTVAPAA